MTKLFNQAHVDLNPAQATRSGCSTLWASSWPSPSGPTITTTLVIPKAGPLLHPEHGHVSNSELIRIPTSGLGVYVPSPVVSYTAATSDLLYGQITVADMVDNGGVTSKRLSPK